VPDVRSDLRPRPAAVSGLPAAVRARGIRLE
jgi:hypothetical protein